METKFLTFTKVALPVIVKPGDPPKEAPGAAAVPVPLLPVLVAAPLVTAALGGGGGGGAAAVGGGGGGIAVAEAHVPRSHVVPVGQTCKI